VLPLEETTMGNTRSSEHSSIDWLAKGPLASHIDAPVAVGRALQRDRAMARAREHDDHPSLRLSRPRNEGEGARPIGSARYTDTSVPSAGFIHAFPEDAVTMRSNAGLNSGRAAILGVCVHSWDVRIGVAMQISP
jgi:hypothetical protein